jgi:hypothetical protein
MSDPARPRPGFKLLAIRWIMAGTAFGSRADPFAVDSFTIDGGGGTSSGGLYMLAGTVGQPDGGISSGGSYQLAGGFWPGMVLPFPGVPTLSIRLLDVALVLSGSPANPAFILEMTDNLGSLPWTQAPPGNPVTVDIGGSPRFFRLRWP